MALEEHFANTVDVTGAAEQWAAALPGKAGVFALVDEHDRLVLLASSLSLRRMLTYRLTHPPEASKKRADLAAVTRRIHWTQTCSPFETDWLFHRIARQLEPKHYRKLCAFSACWFVHIDPQARLPKWTIEKELAPSGVTFGPFPTRASAATFVETLDDLFDLCRKYSILDQTPQGIPCAYFEMGKCPAPCSGRIPLEQYHEMVAAAVAFARGQRQSHIERWQSQMRAAAQTQAFEQAAALKQRLDRTAALDAPNYRLVRPMDEFNYLILQRGEGRMRIQPFFVRQGHLEPGEPVPRKKLADTAPKWLETMHTPPPPVDDKLHSEWIWLVAHYLFRAEKVAGLFLPINESTSPASWISRVDAALFGKPLDSTDAQTDSDPEKQQNSTSKRSSDNHNAR